MLVFFMACMNSKKIENKMPQSALETCQTFDCLETNKNKKAIILGDFQPYTPNTGGKGAGHMFWDWEIVLKDSVSIPVVSRNEYLDLASFNGHSVQINGLIFYGIIIGSPEGQNATGYRIDADDIQLK